MLDYTDTNNFNRFVGRLLLDSTVFNEASVDQRNDTIIIHAKFPLIDHGLKLVYVPNDSNNIKYAGDVYFDSTRVIITNANCSLTNRGCINRLYDQNELKIMMSLKSPEKFTRDDAFEFLLRLNEKLR